MLPQETSTVTISGVAYGRTSFSSVPFDYLDAANLTKKVKVVKSDKGLVTKQYLDSHFSVGILGEGDKKQVFLDYINEPASARLSA